MAISDEIRLLAKKWSGGTGWPQRLEWVEVRELRGWKGQRLEFRFPIVAIVGENGSGKSTLLQAAACAYRSESGKKGTWFPAEFFPETAWERIRGASISYGFKQGEDHHEGSVRKRTTRWLGHVERPVRSVVYRDLSRVQPVGTRVGYARIAKTKHVEVSATDYEDPQVHRLSAIMGRTYDSAKMALSSVDDSREVPVITRRATAYSGFHQGMGETTITELLQVDLPKYGLVLIDEIESSLHPRAQRRLIRDLAQRCRNRECQVIFSTHSPYILEELPADARVYIIMDSEDSRKIVTGVSPQFAMTKMDDETYPECDLYVEDQAAKVMLGEIMAHHGKEIFTRCAIVPFGAASVGYALGQMVANKKFPRPSLVFLDGDSDAGDGCQLLPGGDAPEQVVFGTLEKEDWGEVWARIARDISLVRDACTNAMTLDNHHDWIRFAANQLMHSGDALWRAMCAEWAKKLSEEEAGRIVDPIRAALD